MRFDRESSKPSLDMVMHIGLAVVFVATIAAGVDWSQMLNVIA